MVPGWLHGAKKAAFGHVRPSNVSLYFSLLFLFIRISIYIYICICILYTHKYPKRSPRNSILSHIVREGRVGGRVMRSGPASKAAHQPIVSDTHTQTHAHRRQTLSKTVTQNGSKKYTKPVAKSCVCCCILWVNMDSGRTGKKLLWAAKAVRKKSCSGSLFMCWRSPY